MVRLLLGVEAGLLEVYCFVHVLGRLVGTLNLQGRGFSAFRLIVASMEQYFKQFQCSCALIREVGHTKLWPPP